MSGASNETARRAAMLRDMARILVEQRLMNAEEAEAQVTLFLTRLHEDSERG